MAKCWLSTGAEGSLSRHLRALGLAVLRRKLPAVDEVLELLFVLVGVPVRLVSQHAPLLDEVFERRPGIARGAEAKVARRLRCGEGSSPSEQVEELGGQRREPAPPQCKRGELQPDGREERRMQLAGGVEQFRKRLRSGGGD